MSNHVEIENMIKKILNDNDDDGIISNGFVKLAGRFSIERKDLLR
jgi:hypothetical protein